MLPAALILVPLGVVLAGVFSMAWAARRAAASASRSRAAARAAALPGTIPDEAWAAFIASYDLDE